MENELNKLDQRLTRIETNLDYLKETNKKIFDILESLTQIEKSNVQQSSEIRHMERELAVCKKKYDEFENLKSDVKLIKTDLSKYNKFIYSIGTTVVILVIKAVIDKLG